MQTYRAGAVLERSQGSVAVIKPVRLWQTDMPSNDVHQKDTGPVPMNVRTCRVGQGKHQIRTDDACLAGDSTLSRLMSCGLIPVRVCVRSRGKLKYEVQVFLPDQVAQGFQGAENVPYAAIANMNAQQCQSCARSHGSLDHG